MIAPGSGRNRNAFNPAGIIRFLEPFTRPDLKPGGWSVLPGGGLPRLEYNSTVLEFISEVRNGGWTPEGFRWIGWQKEATRYRDVPALIDSATLDDCRRLLVTLVELDCHRDGFLGEMITGGLVTRVIERVKKLAVSCG
jgi:hypothetical protein